MGKFVTHRSWRKCPAGLKDLPWEVKTEYRQRGTWDLGTCLCKAHGWSVLGSQATTSLVNMNQKSEVLVSPWGVLPKEYEKSRHGGREDCWSWELLGRSCHKCTFTCDSTGCYVGHAIAWRAAVTLGSLWTHWPNKAGAKAAILGSNLVSLSTKSKMFIY